MESFLATCFQVSNKLQRQDPNCKTYAWPSYSTITYVQDASLDAKRRSRRRTPAAHVAGIAAPTVDDDDDDADDLVVDDYDGS